MEMSNTTYCVCHITSAVCLDVYSDGSLIQRSAQSTRLEPLPAGPSRAEAAEAAAPLVRRRQRHRTCRRRQVVSHL